MKTATKTLTAAAFLFITAAAWNAPAQAQCCLVPDNGSGTADLPPHCIYLGHTEIVDGLPPGSTIQIDASIQVLSTVTEVVGGGLGGHAQDFTYQLVYNMTGTGVFAAYNRVIVFPFGPAAETHSAPRTPFTSPQTFAMDLYTLQAQIVGDPDFDLLRVTAGTGFGMPSPGVTMLTQMGPNWGVNSYFDITHRNDFVGRPGGPFGGMSGSTTRVARFSICQGDPTPVLPGTWGGIKALYGS